MSRSSTTTIHATPKWILAENPGQANVLRFHLLLFPFAPHQLACPRQRERRASPPRYFAFQPRQADL